jgi:Cellulase (glycosyl hydrolase family 5)
VFRGHLGSSAILLSCLIAVACQNTPPPPAVLEVVRAAPANENGFVLSSSGATFVPWGFNYDRDWNNRLLEDYWTNELSLVAQDFAEMKALGANVVRVHLQFGKFMNAPDQPNPAALERLEQVVRIAEDSRVYLLLTGLGCYKKEDVPAWYDNLSEATRWAAQARFWEAVARRVGKSPAIFAYDLVNEPVIPDQPRPPGGWLTDQPFGERYFVQYIVLDRAGRKPEDIARAWIQTIRAAIRKHDPTHMLTVGLLPFANGAGFVPSEIVKDLDFISAHVYPEEGKIDTSLELLRAYQHGKPVVVTETYPLMIGADGMRDFLRHSRSEKLSAGWFGFYWGRTLPELTPPEDFGEAFMKLWLGIFVELDPNKP